jgi:ATP-dependent protease Clp ATPase subunit
MKLFEYENVKLRFTDDALEAIAESALERKIGARGLRMIIEDLMLDLMYQVPEPEEGPRSHDHPRSGDGEGQADHADREGG